MSEKTITLQDRIRVEPGAWNRRIGIFGGIAAAGIAASVVGYLSDPAQFAFSYMVPFLFFLTLGLSGLLITMMQHLSRSGWSVALRRIPEVFATAVPLFAILFLPVVLGMYELFHWTHADAVAKDALLQHKEPYLNSTFFYIRAAGYFVIWFLLTRYFFASSVKQDETGDPATTVTLQRRSAPGMILFAFTLTFAGFDWIMSMDPHWYSTIFGVYIFSGSALAGFGFMFLVALGLRRGGYLATMLRLDHFRDLGRLIFAFTVFWAYIAFSQYFLIWYGNIPEETIFYAHRMEGSWKALTYFLAAGHFAVPFLLLMSRWTKSRPGFVALMAVWVLLMHYIDIYWLVMPVLHHHGVSFHWMDVACFLAVGGVFMTWTLRTLSRVNLVPIGDPRLPESIRLHNDY